MWFNRAFHPDEANQAFTVGALLETGAYRYRPEDHHGPTLYYAAAPLQKAAGVDSTAALDGNLLRCTPLVFALATAALAFCAVRKISRCTLPAIAAAALLLTAPIVAFHSTYFIQETLLGCFLAAMFCAAAHYTSAKRPGKCALLFGAAAGLAFATKETCAISFAAAAIAAAPSIRNFLKNRATPPDAKPFNTPANHAVLAALAFLVVAILLFSSFGANWQGVWDAFVAAPAAYLRRAAGSAASDGAANHVHEFAWYLKLLFTGNLVHTHFVLLGAIAAAGFAARRNPWFRFALGYAALTILLYSLIPYKTPWCLLTPVQAMLLALALAWPRETDATKRRRAVCAAAIAGVLAFNALGLAAISRDPNSKSIPWNYANASPEAEQLAQCAAAAMRNPAAEPFIAVAVPTEDVWPFPWYNRALESVTGYWTSIEELERLAAQGRKPSVVIVPMSEGHLAQALFPHLKNTKRFYMRPGVRMRIFW